VLDFGQRETVTDGAFNHPARHLVVA
jgi:hypothetical protein